MARLGSVIISEHLVMKLVTYLIGTSTSLGNVDVFNFAIVVDVLVS